jgi:hypothetical protein
MLTVLVLVWLQLAAYAREDEAPMPTLGQTWVDIAGVTYGAKPDALGPIGGGRGYTRLVTGGQYQVATIDELLDALKKAKAGETVFLDPKAELDFTALVYAENLVIGIPEGVTLASNRGQDGSPGALLCSEAFQTSPLIRALGPKVRVTGLRVRGPDPKTRLDHHRRAFSTGREEKDASGYYYKLPNSDGIATEFAELEVDNCELSGWSSGAVSLADGTGQHVHHCYIHHNQRNGLGYGVVMGYGKQAVALIEYNLFDYNRHSIAGTGKPGNAYEARHNVEGGHAISHYFDLHGGADRKDGTSIAGDWLKVHHNTFLRADQRAILIRGIPQEQAELHHNWFAATEPGPAVIGPWPTGGGTRVVSHDNAYGTDKPEVKDKGE